VFRGIDAFRGDAALSSWIYRITFTTAMSFLRRRRPPGLSRWPRVTPGVSDRPTQVAPLDLVDSASLADDRFLREQLRRRVAEALVKLPAIYRLPVMLRDVEGLSTREASDLLRVKAQTLKSRLHRGRLILRNELADFAGGISLNRRPAVATGRARLAA
jgi:RNA polymerase sigma-70 factor, ECF subfamily